MSSLRDFSSALRCMLECYLTFVELLFLMPIKFFNSDLLLNWCTMSYSNADISFSVIWVFFSSFFDMFVSIFLFAASLLLITLNPDSFPWVISDDLFMNTVWQTLLPRLSSYLALYRMIFFILVVLFIRFSLS